MAEKRCPRCGNADRVTPYGVCRYCLEKIAKSDHKNPDDFWALHRIGRQMIEEYLAKPTASSDGPPDKAGAR